MTTRRFLAPPAPPPCWGPPAGRTGLVEGAALAWGAAALGVAGGAAAAGGACFGAAGRAGDFDSGVPALAPFPRAAEIAFEASSSSTFDAAALASTPAAFS